MGKYVRQGRRSMTKLSLAVVLVAITAMFAPALTAQQGGTRFEYLKVTPYIFRTPQGSGIIEHIGYRACLAASSDWTCREFTSLEPSDAALRAALVTLGDEGWELVSAVDERLHLAHTGLTYLFKRPR